MKLPPLPNTEARTHETRLLPHQLARVFHRWESVSPETCERFPLILQTVLSEERTVFWLDYPIVFDMSGHFGEDETLFPNIPPRWRQVTRNESVFHFQADLKGTKGPYRPLIWSGVIFESFICFINNLEPSQYHTWNFGSSNTPPPGLL